MFYIDCDWLRYFPYKHYKLPEITEAGIGRLIRKKSGECKTVQTYRLHWPGRCNKCDIKLPKAIVDAWGGNSESLYLVRLLLDGVIPKEAPESIAYHLAVNKEFYDTVKEEVEMAEFPVAGLPYKYVRQVLDAEFAIEPEYFAAIKYLKWLAEGHYHHPLFQDFDTLIRDDLDEINNTAVRLFFRLLGDCLYDRKAQWWDRNENTNIWDNLACYLHWVGRTGMGLYDSKSKLSQSYNYLSNQSLVPQDLLDRLDAWNKGALDKCRKNSNTYRDSGNKYVEVVEV